MSKPAATRQRVLLEGELRQPSVAALGGGASTRSPVERRPAGSSRAQQDSRSGRREPKTSRRSVSNVWWLCGWVIDRRRYVEPCVIWWGHWRDSSCHGGAASCFKSTAAGQISGNWIGIDRRKPSKGPYTRFLLFPIIQFCPYFSMWDSIQRAYFLEWQRTGRLTTNRLVRWFSRKPPGSGGFVRFSCRDGLVRLTDRQGHWFQFFLFNQWTVPVF
jgi:hypothetical protein